METILVVDDNKNMQFILTNILQEEGYVVRCMDNGNDAIKFVKNKKPDLVLLDIRLPGKNGIEVLKILKSISEDIQVIMITAYGDVKSAVKVIKLGAYDYVTKPFDNDELLYTIKRALQTSNLAKEVESLKKQLYDQTESEREMGQSPEIQKVIKQVNLVSPTKMSVIIQGKSGTGKEVIANMIHRKSKRAHKPFVAVDCGAIPDNLVESELLGYEKGAFTGAENMKKGEFELAQGGTLFLDEISNLPLAGQAKLLRVLQERQFRRIGGVKPIFVDIRIIVATNLNLATLIQEGKFREDLFHRLSEFKIQLPNLSERIDDLPILAKEFLNEGNRELGKKVKDISSEALQKIMTYQWPGNIRELKHVLKRAVLLCAGDTINVNDIQFEFQLGDNRKNTSSIQNYLNKIIVDGMSLSDVISKINSETEKDIIKRILTEVKYNKSKAAKILGIDRNTLYSKIKNLNIE